MSRSYANLLDLSGDAPLFTRPMQKTSKGSLTRSATASGALSDKKDDESSVGSDTPSSVSQERLIVVANQLPLHAERDAETKAWKFRWDEDALLLQMRDGIMTADKEDMEVIYVGSLKAEVDPSEQDAVATLLLDKFNCVPTFLPSDLLSRFYHGFCKQQLWPLFHYMLPLSPQHGGLFERDLWQAYVSANKIFSDKVMEVISPEDDYVWVHDYHLMVLPTFLRKRFNRVRLGFFLHSPFPSSEIYRTLPVRDEILRALLNADLIGFHTFDYARHFLSCCSRMLGLEYESKRGYIGLDYYGRTVGIKIMPVGIHMGQLSAKLQLPDTEWRAGELKAQFAGKKLILGVDDMDIFKGIGLKLMAMEQMLRQHPEWVGKAVMVQIANPARGRGRDVMEMQEEVHAIARRINTEFGREGYEPVLLLQRHVPVYERVAFYTMADCLVVTAVRDGMNLTPYEYIVCRQGVQEHTQPAPPPLIPAAAAPATAPASAAAAAPAAAAGSSQQPIKQVGFHIPDVQPGSAAAPVAAAVSAASTDSSSSAAAAPVANAGAASNGAAGEEAAAAAAAAGVAGGATTGLLSDVGLPTLAPIYTGRERTGGAAAGPGGGRGGEDGDEKKRSVIVVSEFIGCSPSLSGAIRVNPWNTQAVADALNSALTMSSSEQEARHEKHFNYVRQHHVGYWAHSFISDLQRTCREHSRLRCYGIGFGLGFRTVALDPNFRKLQTELIASAYKRAKSRVLMLDYDGTMMPQTSVEKRPSAEVLDVIDGLCSDPRNIVFIVSGRTRDVLSQWFVSCPRLGLAAEHGYFISWTGGRDWQTSPAVKRAAAAAAAAAAAGSPAGASAATASSAGTASVPDNSMLWKEVALPVMELYTESTDGSYVEEKESALVWHHRDADPDFGSWQAKELLDHLESVLANEPVVVRRGHHIVEVKPQGVSKGVVVEQLLSFVTNGGRGGMSAAAAAAAAPGAATSPPTSPDFVLCVGDDRSDEDMFERMESIIATAQRGPGHVPIADVFACTVGQKPSKAKYYLDDTSEVLKMLRGLADAGSGAATASSASNAPASGRALGTGPGSGNARSLGAGGIPLPRPTAGPPSNRGMVGGLHGGMVGGLGGGMIGGMSAEAALLSGFGGGMTGFGLPAGLVAPPSAVTGDVPSANGGAVGAELHVAASSSSAGDSELVLEEDEVTQ